MRDIRFGFHLFEELLTHSAYSAYFFLSANSIRTRLFTVSLLFLFFNGFYLPTRYFDISCAIKCCLESSSHISSNNFQMIS